MEAAITKPDSVVRVQSYLQHKSHRVSLESQVQSLRKQLAGIEKELSDTRTQEQTTVSLINPDSLINRKSFRVINDLLSRAVSVRVRGEELPVGCAVLESNGSKSRLNLVFSQPVFHGWHTERPYVSYQVCPVQLETPVPPDENHIPDYIQVVEWDLQLSCWERSGNELSLWGGLSEQGALIFMLAEKVEG